jgi:hypothetical protein
MDIPPLPKIANKNSPCCTFTTAYRFGGRGVVRIAHKKAPKPEGVRGQTGYLQIMVITSKGTKIFRTVDTIWQLLNFCPFGNYW